MYKKLRPKKGQNVNKSKIRMLDLLNPLIKKT
jgi:hypothetical protein